MSDLLKVQAEAHGETTDELVGALHEIAERVGEGFTSGGDGYTFSVDEVEGGPPLIEDKYLAVWFTPDAIKDTFGMDAEDDPRRVWAMNASDEELREVGNGCVSSDAIWQLFRELIEENIDEAIASQERSEHDGTGTRT